MPIEEKPTEKQVGRRKEFLSTMEAAVYLGISYPTFRKYREQGRIPFRKVGDKLYKYDVADLEAFARKINARSA